MTIDINEQLNVFQNFLNTYVTSIDPTKFTNLNLGIAFVAFALVFVIQRFVIRRIWSFLEHIASTKTESTEVDDYFIMYFQKPLRYFLWVLYLNLLLLLFSNLSPLPFVKMAIIYLCTAFAAALIRAIMETECIKYAENYTSDFKYDELIFNLSSKPVYILIYSIGAILALNELGAFSEFLAQNVLNLSIMLIKVFGSVIFSYVVWSQIDYQVKKRVRLSFKDDKKYARQLVEMFSQVSLYIFIILLFLTVVSSLGINFTPWLAGFTGLGLAISFAAQGTIKNILSGVFILVDRPFKVGDYIKLGEVEGYVTTISLKNMRLRSVSGELITVPNSGITEQVIYNQSEAEKLTKEMVTEKKVILRVGISYDSDFEKAEKILNEIMTQVDEVNTNIPNKKPAQVFLVELSDFSLKFDLEFWSFEGNIKKTKHVINKEILKRFKKEGINIPFPTEIHYVHQESN